MGILGRKKTCCLLPDKQFPDLCPLDVNKIANDLGFLAEAKRLGEAGIPSLRDTVNTGPEARAVQHIEKARQGYVDWANISRPLIASR